MNDLRRELAPLSAKAWQAVEDEARRVLKLFLAGRKLVDFKGPLGWEASALGLGSVERVRSGPVPGVEAAVRKVLPFLELRTSFELRRQELDDVERGSDNPELAPLVEAAKRLGRAEDAAIFHGYPAGGTGGILDSTTHKALTIPESYEEYPATVAEATRMLRDAGIDGPYAIALGPRCYAGLTQATARGGYPVFEIVKRLLDGPAVWAPAVDGAAVLSMRGGDYELAIGRDLSIGYESHDETDVRLYLIESLAFRTLTPEAAVALRYRSGRR